MRKRFSAAMSNSGYSSEVLEQRDWSGGRFCEMCEKLGSTRNNAAGWWECAGCDDGPFCPHCDEVGCCMHCEGCGKTFCENCGCEERSGCGAWFCPDRGVELCESCWAERKRGVIGPAPCGHLMCGTAGPSGAFDPDDADWLDYHTDGL